MKNLFLIPALLVLLFLSCSDDDNRPDCEQKANAIGFAAAAYSENPSVSTCESYKNAIQDSINANCGDKDQLEVLRDSLNCSAENF